MLVFSGNRLYGEDHRFHCGAFVVQKGRITAFYDDAATLLKLDPVDRIDFGDSYVIPSPIDLHTHGNSGFDFTHANSAAFSTCASYLASRGVGAFLPTLASASIDTLLAACRQTADFMRSHRNKSAAVCGLYLEAPFLSQNKCGAQNAAFLAAPDIDLFMRLWDASQGQILLVCIAPELEGALPFIREVSKKTHVSLAHTLASYELASAAFDAGADHLTHMWNAMPPLLHRAPGPIAAAAERDNITVELIADGVHVHPTMLRLAFRLFGAARICLISDSLSLCGAKTEQGLLADVPIHREGSTARLCDGTLAGSAVDLTELIRIAVGNGVPLVQAVCAAADTPAVYLGMEKERGRLAVGRRADLTVLNAALEREAVYLGGERVFPA